MLLSSSGQQIAEELRKSAGVLVDAISDAFSRAIVGVTYEEPFMDRLLAQLEHNLSGIVLPRIQFKVRIGKIHQTPIGSTQHYSCELGDPPHFGKVSSATVAGGEKWHHLSDKAVRIRDFGHLSY